jgi:hypothetical protein
MCCNGRIALTFHFLQDPHSLVEVLGEGLQAKRAYSNFILAGAACQLRMLHTWTHVPLLNVTPAENPTQQSAVRNVSARSTAA